MEKKNNNEFVMNATTKEQYLKFKEDLKKESYHPHSFYIAYYIFKHRIGRDLETDLVDTNVIEKYLDEVVIPACYKGLYHGRIVGTGGECINYAKRYFKDYVRSVYNKYATYELDGKREE